MYSRKGKKRLCVQRLTEDSNDGCKWWNVWQRTHSVLKFPVICSLKTSSFYKKPSGADAVWISCSLVESYVFDKPLLSYSVYVRRNSVVQTIFTGEYPRWNYEINLQSFIFQIVMPQILYTSQAGPFKIAQVETCIVHKLFWHLCFTTCNTLKAWYFWTISLLYSLLPKRDEATQTLN